MSVPNQQHLTLPTSSQVSHSKRGWYLPVTNRPEIEQSNTGSHLLTERLKCICPHSTARKTRQGNALKINRS